MTTLAISELEGSLGALDLNVPIPQFASADVLNKPLDLYRTYLADILSSLVEGDPTVAYNSIQLANDSLPGDLTVILPKLFPKAKVGELAHDLVKKFPQCPLFSLPFVDGVHLRIFVTPETLPRLLLPYIIERKDTYGKDLTLGLHDPSTPTGGCKKLIVEFSSPNIASEFQGKHLRSTIIGGFVSSLHEQMGWDVTRINYFGDWGKDIALLGVGWEKFGSEEAFQEDPTTHLLDVYHKIHELFSPEQAASKKVRDEAKKKAQDDADDTAEIESKGLFAERNDFFKRMENGDEAALALYKRIRDVNIENYVKLYARLGISFDEYSGESQVSHETMVEVEQMLKDKEISEESGGAWIVQPQKYGAKSGTAVIRDRSGSSTYFLRYLAAVIERSRKSEFDKMIFVAADRTGHFSRLFKILEALDMGDLAGKLQHVNFNDVSQMTEKLGHGHQPHEILNQCEKAMLEVLKTDGTKAEVLGNTEDAAKAVGITALISQELSTKKASDHAFDISGMTSFKPGTGSDLQYWYARLCSILKAHPITEDLPIEEYGSLSEEEHTSLLLVLGQYPDVTHAVFKSLESATIMTYLGSVIEHLSDCLDNDDDNEENREGAGEGSNEAVGESKTEETNISPAQAALYEATRTVLENGMKLLGLTPFAKLQHDRADTPIAE